MIIIIFVYLIDHDDSLSIGFNPKYLIESLNAVIHAIKGNQVELHFLNASSPILLKTIDNAKDIFVIMPVKV